MHDTKWLEGFTKIAMVNGLDQAQALELLKIAQRLHFMNTNQEKYAEGFKSIEKQAVRVAPSVWRSFAKGMAQGGQGLKGLGKPLAQIAGSPLGTFGAGMGGYALLRYLMGKKDLPPADPLEQTGKQMQDLEQRAKAVKDFRTGGQTANSGAGYGGYVPRPAGSNMLF